MLRFRVGDEVFIEEDVDCHGGKYGEVIEIVKEEERDFIGYDYKLFIDGEELYFYDNELNFATATDFINRSYSQIGCEIGKLVEEKQAAYGDSFSKAFDLIKVFLRDYKNEDGNYIIPEELLRHLLIQVRILDKQNRIFSNPKGDLMGESPYKDCIGYSLLALKMQEN